MIERLPRVLVLSRNYPNRVLGHQGPWVQRQTEALALRGCEMTVVAPTPYWPPLPGPDEFTRLRHVESHRREGTVEVIHPRFVVGPGYTTYVLEAVSYFTSVRRPVKRRHSTRPFDLIHAHFSYPDGAVAVALGLQLGIPVVVTEHVLWRPSMDQHPLARWQARWAVGRAAACVAVSDAVRNTMLAFLAAERNIHVIPVGVDAKVFPLKAARQRQPNDQERILFVGWINYVKGIDVLLDSMTLLIAKRPRLRLTIVGGAFFRHKRRQQESLQRTVQERGLGPYVAFAGPRSAAGVAEFMRHTDLLVLPSRRESCGSVLLEALASGTPVVATRSGGPDGIVTEDVGILTPTEDPAALAAAIERVLDRLAEYDPVHLREYALAKFSWDRLAESYLSVYRSMLHDGAA